MLRVCEPGDEYSVPWVNQAFSRCFLELAGAISCAGLLYVIGVWSIVLGSKPAKGKIPASFMSSISAVFTAMVTVSVLMATTYGVDLVVKGVLHIAGDEIYGYVIVVDALGIVSWLFSIVFLIRESHMILRGHAHSLTLAIFWIMNIVWLSLQLVSFNGTSWWWHLNSHADITDLALFVIRCVLLVVMVTLGVFRPLCCKPRANNYSLLINQGSEVNVDHTPQDQERREGRFVRKRTASAFSGIVHTVKALFPYVWPKGHLMLQLRVVVCFLILVSGRVLNVYVPLYYKKIVNALTPSTNHTPSSFDQTLGFTHAATGITFPIASILIYVTMKFMQGGSVGSIGLLSNIRSFLWIRVQQYTTRALQVDLFRHLHSLSLRWHLGRKTGEVLQVMNRGTQSINNLLSYVLFNILPTLVDVGVAVVFFVIAFDGWFGLIVFTTMISYIYFTIFITEWRTQFRRSMNVSDNETKAKAVDSLLNFETVKYYGAEEYEVTRFLNAILNYQRDEWKALASLVILNVGQNVIITMGLLLGATLCAYRVTQGVLDVGDFVLYITYIIQLYSPLNFFGTYYRLIQQAFIDMENLLDLLDVDPEIQDMLGARPIQLSEGKIEFRNVYFHYTPEKPILHDVSFTVEPGKTLALVGPSGAGKSTIIRLLFRFYDLQDGVILLDGQDVRHVTQASVRQNIGVVPQDTVLFNDIIRYNIRYGKVDASDDEVEQAANYADIHERILTFPKQYETVVGERGLKLSGGEKQRVCIARTILKAPGIILLDEATSALDTETERNIQASLMKVCQGRTTVIVAHRLSTIIHADQILVLKDGVIAECGNHDNLLAQEGLYAAMWKQQQKSLKTSAHPVEDHDSETTL